MVVEEATEPVVCRHGPECDAKWRRAREWVGMHSRWPIREDTDALVVTDGPDDTRDPAFVIRRVASGTSAGTDVIVFGAGCTDRVRAFVDHVPARGGRSPASSVPSCVNSSTSSSIRPRSTRCA